MKQIKLNENTLKQLVAESVKKILKEGMSSDNPSIEKWEKIKETLGAEQMLSDIFQYLDSNVLEQIIEWFNEDYDLFYDTDDD